MRITGHHRVDVMTSKLFRNLVLLGVLGVAACVTGRPATATELATTRATQQLADAQQLVVDENWPPALAALRSIIEAKTFSGLSSDFQYRTLSIAGKVAVDHGPPQLAFDYFGRVLAMPQADFDDGLGRLRAADKLGNKSDSISALTLLMQRWPDRAAKLDSDYILAAANKAEHLRSGVALALLQALYDAHWKLKWDFEPSGVWRDLALLLLEKDRFTAANDVARHVTDAYVLIAMRADRRFDAVVAANPAQFDIETAAEREFQAFEAAAEKTPQSLEVKSWVIYSLLNQQRYEGALAASDSILSDIRSTNYPEKLFVDYGAAQAWFLNLRSVALQRVGRWDEAVAQMTEASLLVEKYSGNVDQLTNLGYLYCSLGRPTDALSAIGSVVAGTSPFGAMQIEAVRLDAASQLGDLKQVERSLQFLRAHRADAPSTYELALVDVKQLDRAAHELVTELRDPVERQDALLSVQNFAPTLMTARDQDLDARQRAVIARSDVQAAIHHVGRVETYKLEEQ
jgi:tetratricopeptide (TPR) repeat protein